MSEKVALDQYPIWKIIMYLDLVIKTSNWAMRHSDGLWGQIPIDLLI